MVFQGSLCENVFWAENDMHKLREIRFLYKAQYFTVIDWTVLSCHFLTQKGKNKYIHQISHSSTWSKTNNKKHQYNDKNNDKHHSKNHKFQS